MWEAVGCKDSFQGTKFQVQEKHASDKGFDVHCPSNNQTTNYLAFDMIQESKKLLIV